MAPLRNPPKTKTRPSIAIVPASKRVKGVFGSADQSPRAGCSPRNLTISPRGSLRPARNPAPTPTPASRPAARNSGIHLPRRVARMLSSLRFEGDGKGDQAGSGACPGREDDELPAGPGAIRHGIGVPDATEVPAPQNVAAHRVEGKQLLATSRDKEEAAGGHQGTWRPFDPERRQLEPPEPGVKADRAGVADGNLPADHPLL